MEDCSSLQNVPPFRTDNTHWSPFCKCPDVSFRTSHIPGSQSYYPRFLYCSSSEGNFVAVLVPRNSFFSCSSKTVWNLEQGYWSSLSGSFQHSDGAASALQWPFLLSWP
ncbi:hypothetical protein TIFTF001_048631 [Ficus carica]|uniref:Uncharacterized protein n=1 Tax=Ficus carica TaxID=3494 RepID=A0AA88CV69_FICCA|nr:hypothetical protein TIFTF001_048626 [Ficus carica]GMN19554.1 hypothetical protein TIFTF001_048631 [Ficus carica]